MKIKTAVVKNEINTDEDIEIFQNTTFEKFVKCHAIISRNQRWSINARNIDARNIDALDINALDIDARNINARNINAWDINALDINALDINAWNIICETRIKKYKTAKTMARIFITEKSKLERKEW